MKKTVFFTLTAILAGLIIFFTGWMNIRVSTGNSGILVSKRTGVVQDIVRRGSFNWCWQALIPGDVHIVEFPETVFKIEKSISDQLDSAAVFSSILPGKPDFSYSFKFEIYLKINSNELLPLFEKGVINDKETLATYLDSVAENASRDLAAFMLSEKNEQGGLSWKSEKLITQSGITEKFKSVTFTEINVKESKIPDMDLYRIAQESYIKFQDLVNENLKMSAKIHADNFLADERTIRKLQAVSELIKANPELGNILSGGKAAEVLKALNDF